MGLGKLVIELGEAIRRVLEKRILEKEQRAARAIK